MGGRDIDINQLITELTKACPDFGVRCNYNDKQQSLGFVSLVIYTIGPALTKKPRPNEPCKIRMNSNTCVVIYKSNTARGTDAPVFKDGHLILTLKEAQLLAAIKHQEILESMPADSTNYMLTPLAISIFHINCIDKLAAELNTNPISVVVAINSSCYDGSHCLPASECHIGVIAAQYKTKAYKDDRERDAIISKVKKQYLKFGKEFDVVKYDIFLKYAYLQHIDIQMIIDLCENTRLAATLERHQKELERADNTATELNSTKNVPSTSSKNLN